MEISLIPWKSMRVNPQLVEISWAPSRPVEVSQLMPAKDLARYIVCELLGVETTSGLELRLRSRAHGRELGEVKKKGSEMLWLGVNNRSVKVRSWAEERAHVSGGNSGKWIWSHTSLSLFFNGVKEGSGNGCGVQGKQLHQPTDSWWVGQVLHRTSTCWKGGSGVSHARLP